MCKENCQFVCVTVYNFSDFLCILHFCLLAVLDIHLISHLIVLHHHLPCPTPSSFPFCKPLYTFGVSFLSCCSVLQMNSRGVTGNNNINKQLSIDIYMHSMVGEDCLCGLFVVVMLFFTMPHVQPHVIFQVFISISEG